MRAATPGLVMTDAEREVLEALGRAQLATHGEVRRARALFGVADGEANAAIARRLGVSPATVTAWRARFDSDRLGGSGQVRKGRGRKPSIPKAKIDAIVDVTLHSKPPGETHWSTRSMAKAQGVSPATVQRVWSAR
jgi:hypothetical protein